MPFELTDRQRRLVDAVLVLAVIALAFIVVADLANVFYTFGDILLLFFLAWLLSFVAAAADQPRGDGSRASRRRGAVIIVYLTIVIVLLGILVQASATLATSIGDFIQDAPRFEDQLSNLVAELEARLAALGFQVDLVSQVPADRREPPGVGARARRVRSSRSPSRASASLGNILILVILSIYIVVDREAITAFLYRLVPPGFVDRGPPPPDERRRSRSAASSAARGSWASSFGAITAAVEHRLRARVRGGHDRRGRASSTPIPFFGPFVVLDPAGRRRAPVLARGRAAGR